jgi:uncharacterized protein YndB with AHSA1/START domain
VTEPITLSYELACGPVHAFEVWTERFSVWWPKSHRVSGDPDASVCMEPGLGGRIFERTSDGTEIDWGEITEWEPPRRLGYLWHIRRDRADATDVSITFTDLGNGTTRIDIEHSGWERLGLEGSDWRTANEQAWTGLMPSYLAALD